MAPFTRPALIALALLLAGPAHAGREQAPTPGEALDRVIAEAAAALRAMVDAIPRYAQPEMRDNGDIVIRRLPSPIPPPAAPRRPAPPIPGEAT